MGTLSRPALYIASPGLHCAQCTDSRQFATGLYHNRKLVILLWRLPTGYKSLNLFSGVPGERCQIQCSSVPNINNQESNPGYGAQPVCATVAPLLFSSTLQWPRVQGRCSRPAAKSCEISWSWMKFDQETQEETCLVLDPTRCRGIRAQRCRNECGPPQTPLWCRCGECLGLWTAFCP